MGKARIEALGLYVQLLRESKRLTLNAVAEKIGVSDRAVSSWERGEHTPGVVIMQKLLEGLDGSWLHVQTILTSDVDRSTIQRLVASRPNMPGIRRDLECILQTLSDDQADALLDFIRVMRRAE